MTETKKINNIEEALKALDVTETTLSNEEKLVLDTEGYIVLYGVIDSVQVEEMRRGFDEVFAQNRLEPGFESRGTRQPKDLLNASSAFDRIVTHPLLLAAAYYILGSEFRFRNLSGRDPLQGHGQQTIHTDAQQRRQGEPFSVVNSLWLLDDFTRENGATRFVPGTHLRYDKPKILHDATTPYEGETIISAPAGTVIIFNAHTWHSGRVNHTDQHRRALQVLYSTQNQPGFEVRLENPARFSPAARYIMGI